MNRIRRRLAGLQARVAWLSQLNGSVLKAIWLAIATSVFRDAIFTTRIHGRRLSFRRTDLQILREVFVDQEYSFLKDYLAFQAAPSILDVGGHIGTFGFWALAENPHARVLSVEPDPDTFQVLRVNVDFERAGGRQWRALERAAGEQSGRRLRFSTAGPSMSHRLARDGELEVQSIGLADLISALAGETGSVDLVKIDIEGAEAQLLLGDPAQLGRIQALVIELHPDLCDVESIQMLLKQHFGHIQSIDGRVSSKPLLYCRQAEL